MQSTKKIAVVGAGCAGLTSIKGCKEEGLTPFCFERTNNIGGLWYFRNDDLKEYTAVMESTVMNSSKDMSAFSDFPPPAELPNYLHHTQVIKYFELYAKKFDLLRHIRFNHEVVRIVPTKDYPATGQWIVTAKNTKDNTTVEDVFDGVMVCSGHHRMMNIPTFPGQDNFQGEIIHNHKVKTGVGYKDKKVVIVGLGNSAVDSAVEISNYASEVYISTRHGTWILPRVGHQGLPSDSMFQRRINDLRMTLFKYEKFSIAVEKELNEHIDHEMYGLLSQHRFLSQHPTINDILPSKLIMGLIKVKGSIKTFTDKGIIFDGDDYVTEADAIILATGYLFSFPFLSKDILPVKDNKVDLYKNIFPPNLEHATLAMIGLVQPNGGLFPAFELQARLFALVMNKKRHLPSKAEMIRDIKRKQMIREKRYVASTRHTIEEDWIPYLDTLAKMVGAKPSLVWMALSDPRLFWVCFKGPCLPYQYRLTGPHSWPGARDAIFTWKKRVVDCLKTRQVSKVDPSGTSLYVWLVPLVAIVALFWKFVWNGDNF